MQLVWDLGQSLEPGPAIAVSRERRALIELRDQVLERVTRLYYEHVRARSNLRRALATGASDAFDLELRAAELRAQLDGWSGGAYSRLAPAFPNTDSPQR